MSIIYKQALLILTFAVFSSCAAQKKGKIAGDNNLVSISEGIKGEFSSIEVDDGLRVKIKQDRSPSYVITTDQNLVAVVEIKVIGDALTVRTTQKITKNKKLDIFINVNSLSGIVLKNDAKLESIGKLDLKSLNLVGYDSSSFELDVEADEITVNLLDNCGGELSAIAESIKILQNDRTDLAAALTVNELTVTLQKSAQLKLKGKGKGALINLTDTSALEAKRFEVDEAEITLADRSDVDIEVADNLILSAQDKTTLNLSGKPRIEIKNMSDKATLNKQ